MSGMNTQPTASRGGRLPASLVDSQLEHFENMVEYVSRGETAGGAHAFDHEYWERRIRALDETHELIASQRQRMTKLLDRLASDTTTTLKPRTAGVSG
jgi:hypothetical protein